MAGRPDRVPLILDVDTGIDDALALLYACASPEVELLAVTCVGGNVEARQVAMNTLAILELAGRTDVPVVLGRERPLVRRLVTAADTHGPRGIGYAELPSAGRALEQGEAADRIIELARSRPGEISLVTVGPLTNLAVALEREPALPRLLREHVLMGGAYRTPGNMTPTAEFNVYVDPDAAKRVFAAWSSTAGDRTSRYPLAIGLDVTERVRFLPEHLRRLGLRGGALPLDAERLGLEPSELVGSVAANPLLRFAADALRFYFEFHARYDGFYGAVIHDPFALATALDRSLIESRSVFVDVEARPGLTLGMTIADWRGVLRRPSNLDVAVGADAERFLDRFIDRVGGLAEHSGGHTEGGRG